MSYYETATNQRVDSLKTFQSDIKVTDIKLDEKFQQVLREAQALLELSDREIADAVSVSRPTVNRWINGKNLPYFAMRKPIVTWIGEQLTIKIKRLEASARQFGGDVSVSPARRTASSTARDFELVGMSAKSH